MNTTPISQQTRINVSHTYVKSSERQNNSSSSEKKNICDEELDKILKEVSKLDISTDNFCCFCGINMGKECLSQYCSRQCLYGN
jgi:hypothetical protein